MDQSWGRVTVCQVASSKVGDWALAGSDWVKRQSVVNCWMVRGCGDGVAARAWREGLHEDWPGDDGLAYALLTPAVFSAMGTLPVFCVQSLRKKDFRFGLRLVEVPGFNGAVRRWPDW